jgi:hypothetical protein
LKVIVTDGWGVGVGVGVEFGVAVVFTTTIVVGTSVGTVVTTVVGTGVGAGVGVGVTTGAGWDVQPARRIPINRIERTTSNFFMHLFLLFLYIRIFN